MEFLKRIGLEEIVVILSLSRDQTRIAREKPVEIAIRHFFDAASRKLILEVRLIPRQARDD
jgi:hypothetical protein